MTKNNLKVVKSTKDKELENKEKNKALDAAISQITDTFGKGSVMKLGQQKAMDVESVSTGSLSLDLALGIGGFRLKKMLHSYALPSLASEPSERSVPLFKLFQGDVQLMVLMAL